MKSEHDSFLAYYLTQDDQSAQNFKEVRSTLAPYQVRENQEVSPWGIIHYVFQRPPGDRVPIRERLRDGQGRARSAERVFAGIACWGPS